MAGYRRWGFPTFLTDQSVYRELALEFRAGIKNA
jgi:hypothetical protein